MRRHELDRRRFLGIAAATAVTTALAGCSDDEPDAGDGAPADDGGGGSNGNDGSDGEHLAEEPDYDGWFDDVANYEGTADLTGEDEVGVLNGAGDNGLAFDPPAIAVDPGTTVVWEWTGEGGGHTVTAEDGSFESENTEEAGFTFEHTFEEEGIHRYYCAPHEAVGQKGAVVVQ